MLPFQSTCFANQSVIAKNFPQVELLEVVLYYLLLVEDVVVGVDDDLSAACTVRSVVLLAKVNRSHQVLSFGHCAYNAVALTGGTDELKTGIVVVKVKALQRQHLL